jgi:hypothetical protein
MMGVRDNRWLQAKLRKGIGSFWTDRINGQTVEMQKQIRGMLAKRGKKMLYAICTCKKNPMVSVERWNGAKPIGQGTNFNRRA